MQRQIPLKNLNDYTLNAKRFINENRIVSEIALWLLQNIKSFSQKTPTHVSACECANIHLLI